DTRLRTADAHDKGGNNEQRSEPMQNPSYSAVAIKDGNWLIGIHVPCTPMDQAGGTASQKLHRFENPPRKSRLESGLTQRHQNPAIWMSSVRTPRQPSNKIP